MAPSHSIPSAAPRDLDPGWGKRRVSYDTPLDRYMLARRVRPVDIERAAGINRQLVHRAMAGSDITQKTMRKIVHALREITGDDVAASELFDLGDGRSLGAVPSSCRSV
jgi:hypothetical protein